MLGIAFDIYGTIVLTDCVAENYYKLRRGFREVLREARAKRYAVGFFGDDDEQTINTVLARAGIKGYEVHYGSEFDEDGLKKLPLFKFSPFVYVGDMPRDLRAAEKYKVPFIKVPPFVIKKDKFDMSIVFELADSIIQGKIEQFARKHKLRKIKDIYTNENLRIKIGEPTIAQFF